LADKLISHPDGCVACSNMKEAERESSAFGCYCRANAKICADTLSMNKEEEDDEDAVNNNESALDWEVLSACEVYLW